ncbi:MAG: hypothetical protein HUU20_09485 [Pirellulales bacterium]|nr:hypothetical protein [Pirellulales bacterium]
MSRCQLAFAGLILLATGLMVSSLNAENPTLDREAIKVGLHTATPEEDGFIDRVVGLAEQGKLPAKLVDSTFQWARQKPKNRFQYFKRALILRARRIGIEL